MKFLPVLLLLMMTSMPVMAQPAASVTLDGDRILVAGDRYEVAFSTGDGGIVNILDKAQGDIVSGGEAALWIATFEDDGQRTAAEEAFSYAIDGQRLTLTYTGEVAVTVTISASDFLSMQADVTNRAGRALRLFSFPGDLKFPSAAITDALLPMMPGALLNADFFRKGVTFTDQYPGVMFADYAALRSSAGSLALYSQTGAVVQPVYLGFLPDGDQTLLRHNFKTWIADGAGWSSPVVVVRVGEDYPATIDAYRVENGIDQYPTVADKVGDAAVYFAAPMIKLDLAALGLKFADLTDAVIDRLNFPGLVHFVAFQNGGHDNNYPDFIPPAPRWGTTEDFAALVAEIHRRDGLAVPYTNFSWWDNNGPALTVLPDGVTLPDVIVSDAHGIPAYEAYGPRGGFVVDPNNDYFRAKVAEQHDLLLNTVGMDGIFEDQWGARSAPYDFNPSAADHPDTAYFEGARAHFRAQSASHLMVEQGVDVLARDAVAFMGTNYLWDMLGYRTTAAYTSYYPMAGMLLRDKVLLYQHNLAAQTWTNGKDMLRWNLAQGYSLSNSVFDETIPGLNVDNPWINLVGVFQKYALANYADQRLITYADVAPGITRTQFETYTVFANWNADSAYLIDRTVLPPGGVVVLANDGSVTAGVFTRYGDHDLSTGDHFLLEARTLDDIRLFQPVGADTPISLSVPGWTAVVVEAYRYDGTPIVVVDAALNGGDVAFEYAGVLNGEAVGYYRMTAG